jgi:transposase InsO family protein
LVEIATREKISTLRMDNGGEFNSSEFHAYLQEKRIRRKLTNSYTPQKNGVTEQMNQTLLGMAREILFFKGLSPSYWAQDVHTSIYLRNRSQCSSLDGITHESWYGFKCMIKCIRVFG